MITMREIIKYGFVATLVLIGFNSFGQKPIGNYSCGFKTLHAQNSTATDEDVDVLHYSLQLDFTDFSNQRLQGFSDVTIKTLKSVNEISLQLEKLQVDSVKLGSSTLNYNHVATNLTIQLASASSINQELTLRIYYQGKPIRDASWGGFYYSGVYAFNLGVAFTSSPHNFGRVWFPCMDNFTDRATYSFYITVSDDKKVLCNGLLKEVNDLSDNKKQYHWELSDPIPTYLASIAIAPYVTNESEHKGIPIILSSLKEDSLSMAQSFLHLNDCIDAYLTRYGTHNFERIGFNAVPFNGGAMEHATNIAYPLFGVDGKLTYETLYAHELGHHWWGNTVTCRTAEDMWINEGWASYSERVFLEWVYGKDRYDEDIMSNHKNVLHYAHLRDGDTLAISGVSHENTYGSHVYDKGADVVHTLRGYMGDEDFFKAVESFLTANKFKDVASEDLKNHFQQHTNRDLTAFFDNWVYSPGFPDFQILGYTTKKDGAGYINAITIGQRLRFAPKFFSKVPMDITFYGKDFQTKTYTIELNSERQTSNLITDFVPVYAALDMHKKISDAVTDHFIVVQDTGAIDFADAMMTMQVKSNTDSSLVRVEHHWVGADAYFRDKTTPFLSRERFWTVDGVWNKEFKADATIEYFGRETGTNYSIGYLDVDLIRNTEESMVLMYRANPAAIWEECKDYSWEMGSKFDKRGSFTIHNVQRGQYCFAVKEEDRLGVKAEPTQTADFLSVNPNPTTDSIHVDIVKPVRGTIEITDGNGRLIFAHELNNETSLSIEVSEWPSAIYYLGIVVDNKPYQAKRVLVR